MATEKIAAETRTEFGKGAARRIRRDNKIPAVIYGHGNEPVHVTLPGHHTMMALKHGGANALLALDIDGTSQLALTKQVQVDPIRRVTRAPRLRRRPPRREGHRRRPDPRRRRRRPATRWSSPRTPPSSRGRGHPHPRVHRGLGRGRRPPAPRSTPDLNLPWAPRCWPTPSSSSSTSPSSCREEALEAELEEAEAEAGIEHDDSDAEIAERRSRPRPRRCRGRRRRRRWRLSARPALPRATPR